MRGGSQLFRAENDIAPLGIVTSGGFGISLGAPIAMGYVAISAAAQGTRLFAKVRNKLIPIVIAELPFVPLRYKRL